jgi:hypothetical protein
MTVPPTKTASNTSELPQDIGGFVPPRPWYCTHAAAVTPDGSLYNNYASQFLRGRSRLFDWINNPLIQAPFALAICDMCMEKHDGDHGIGLGSELSQLMALSVLDGIDHWAKEKAHAEAEAKREANYTLYRDADGRVCCQYDNLKVVG